MSNKNSIKHLSSHEGALWPVIGTALIILFSGAPVRGADAPADDATVRLLRTVSETHGPSGFEEPIREIMVNLLRPYVDDIRYDGLGSIIAMVGNSGPRILLTAHMDELGAMVHRIGPDGFISMRSLGGWLDEALPGQRWTILTAKGPIKGVTTIRDAHITTDFEKPLPRKNIFLDVGVLSEPQARELGIAIGDPIAPESAFSELNGTGNYVGKAWDDRAGCAAIVQVLERLKNKPAPCRITCVITTQEETYLAGASTATHAVEADLVIGLEGGVTGDVPGGASPPDALMKLGGGPGVFLFNGSQTPNRKLLQFTREIAAAKAIPLQSDIVRGYGDDTAAFRAGNGGRPSICLLVPVRYTHAHNGVMNRRDYDQWVELVMGLISALDFEAVKRIRDFAPEHRTLGQVSPNPGRTT